MSSISRSWAPLRLRDYRLLFIAGLVSMVGDGIWMVALPWIVIDSGGDSRQVAAVVGAEAVGLVSCVLLGGILADRYPRRAVVGLSYLASVAALGILVVVQARGNLAVWQLVTAAVILGGAAAISGPATDAMTPDLVPEDNLHAANALESVVRSLALRMIGPALGGALIAAVGTLTVLLIDGVSFAIAAACVAAISTSPRIDANSTHQDAAEPAASVPYSKVLSYVASERWLWVLIAWSGILLLLQSGPRQVLLPFLIRDSLGGGPREYGLLLSVIGACALLASLMLAAHKPPENYPLRMLIAWTISAAPLAFMAFVPTFWLLLPLGAVYGFFSTVGNVYWFTLVQTLVPNEVRGRVISIDWLGSLALVPLSIALAGLGSSREFVIWLFVLGGTIPVLLTLITLPYVDFRALGLAVAPGTARRVEDRDPSAEPVG